MQIPCQRLKYLLYSRSEVNLEQQAWKKKGCADAWFVAAEMFSEVGTRKFCFVLKKPVLAVMLICVRATEKAFRASLGSSLWYLCLFRAARDSRHPALTGNSPDSRLVCTSPNGAALRFPGGGRERGIVCGVPCKILGKQMQKVNSSPLHGCLLQRLPALPRLRFSWCIFDLHGARSC